MRQFSSGKWALCFVFVAEDDDHSLTGISSNSSSSADAAEDDSEGDVKEEEWQKSGSDPYLNRLSSTQVKKTKQTHVVFFEWPHEGDSKMCQPGFPVLATNSDRNRIELLTTKGRGWKHGENVMVSLSICPSSHWWSQHSGATYELGIDFPYMLSRARLHPRLK